VFVLLYFVPLIFVIQGIIWPVEMFFCAAGRPVAVSKTGLTAIARVLVWDRRASTKFS
jgi:hypothetical protein